MADTVLVHPNRDKPEAKATKAVVILLLVTSAALILIITIGGWSELQGMEIVSFLYAIVYLVMAFFVTRWIRGFQQQWNTEVEVSRDEADRYGSDARGGEPAPA